MKKVFLVIAVAILLLLFGCFDTMGPSESQAMDKTLSLTWRSAEPFGLEEWRYSGNELTLSIKNNTPETLTLTSVQVDGIIVNDTFEITPNESKLITLQMNKACNSGERFSISKQNVKFVYNSSVIQGSQEMGVADITGICS